MSPKHTAGNRELVMFERRKPLEKVTSTPPPGTAELQLGILSQSESGSLRGGCIHFPQGAAFI
jgi:hypothetical protein